jgi:hypothetical protein
MPPIVSLILFNYLLTSMSDVPNLLAGLLLEDEGVEPKTL